MTINVLINLYKETVAGLKYKWELRVMPAYTAKEMIEILDRTIERYKLFEYVGERQIVQVPGRAAVVTLICTAKTARVLMKALKMIREMMPLEEIAAKPKNTAIDGDQDEDREEAGDS